MSGNAHDARGRFPDDRDPLPPEPWRPTSSEYRRREALEATRQAVRAAKEKGKRP